LKSCPASVSPLLLLRRDLDITDRKSVKDLLGQARPAAVINAAAWVDVDAAEIEPDRAFEVNASGPRYLAEACREIGALLVQVSSDYVFDGEKTSGAYDENDRPNPVNAYGASKRAAENAVQEETDRFCIARTASLYARPGSRARGGNFVLSVLEAAARGETLTVVDDIVMSPTSCSDLAPALWRLVLEGGSGMFHLANQGSCSWHALAEKIAALAGLQADIVPIKAAARKRRARIPARSALATVRDITLRPWEEALREFVEKV
jgi:dTDP-4-dehydrorhamnose reductase